MAEATTLRLIGVQSQDSELERLFKSLQILHRPECRLKDEDDPGTLQVQDWVANRRRGIEFGFEDQTSFVGGHPEDIGQGPMLLTQLYLYSDHPDVRPYSGALPFGLEHSDNCAAVRGKMQQFEGTRRSYIRDVWELPECRLTVSYAGDGARLGFLVLALRPPIIHADAEDAAGLPDIDQIIKVMGRPLDDSELGLVFRHLHIDQSLEDEGDWLSVDFRSRTGFQLQFGYLDGAARMVLTHVTLWPGYSPGAAGWPNALPRGLQFHDGPETMFAKLGRAPDEISERDFVATGMWDFESYGLAIDFSTMDNLILSVQLLAPTALRTG